MIDEKKLVGDIKRRCYIPKEMAEIFVTIVDEQPKVGEWIPCSERLPEKPEANPLYEYKPLEIYLVSSRDEEPPFRAFWNGRTFTDGFEVVDIIAWMPLPEPYREEGDSDEKP